MSTRQLVFPHGTWQRGRRVLFDSDGSENFVMGLARPCRRRDGIAFIVEYLLDAEENAYSDRSTHGLTLDGETSSRHNILSVKAAEVGLVPVHLHSHPKGASYFSAYDDDHEKELHGWLKEHGQPLLWSLVWPYDGDPIARLWTDGDAEPGIVRAGLRPYGHSTAELSALDRQRMFGAGLQQAAATLGIGIVGLGGVGFPVAEQLARCGFRDFVLIDPDHVEVTNLNRLPSTRHNVQNTDVGKLKVRVARRLVRRASQAIGTETTINALPHDINEAPARVLKKLRQCDIILALTDDEYSRIKCLEIALDAGAEYLQAGVDIRQSDQDTITGLYAEVTGAEVNRYCPICTGRLDPGQASVEARRYVGGEVSQHAHREGYIPEVIAPSVMSLNAVASGMLVMEIQQRVSGLGVCDLLQIDMQTGMVERFQNIENQLSGECAVCGRPRSEAQTEHRDFKL